MKREIRFRGISKATGKFVFGDLIQNKDEIVINDDFGHDHSVISKTVVQYTGKYDTNGIDVYEGDVVKYTLKGDSTQREHTSTVEMCNFAWRLDKLWLLTEVETIEVVGDPHKHIKQINYE